MSALTIPILWPEPVKLEAAIEQACRLIAPLWPLENFVAVNPFVGVSHLGFAEAAARFRRVAGVDYLGLAMPQKPEAETPDSLLIRGVLDEISKFCALYFDHGQASWPLPGRDQPIYTAWRGWIAWDHSAAALGIPGFRQTIRALPEDPVAAIGAILAQQVIPADAIEDYLFRALFDLAGWGGYARGLDWHRPFATDSALVGLLAIRLAWGHGLFVGGTATCRRAFAKLLPGRDPVTPTDSAQALQRLETAEAAFQTGLITSLRAGPMLRTRPASEPPEIQAVFCIDVRSEPFRRMVETVGPGIETLGFAGFFGLPLAISDGDHVTPHCPVLLQPRFTLQVPPDTARRGLAAQLWAGFKRQALSGFGYVETMGLGVVASLLRAGLGTNPRHRGRALPALDAAIRDGHCFGLTHEQKRMQAEGILRAMGLTTGFAPLILLVGHGASSVNNPHAASLDCGACGGQSGETNARAVAAILNDPAIRSHLAQRGIMIPAESWFLAALHDTTTDDVMLFDDGAPPPQQDRIKALTRTLAEARALVRVERAARLGLPTQDSNRLHAALIARSRDAAETRPEWGLAGNAAFIAAPRRSLRGVDLGGRVFLHSYDYQSDPDLSQLTLIMTAPLIVASWINLQYYAATVNNRDFGGGNKTLHTVCGRIGVLEGNGGMLRPGLPLQSLGQSVGDSAGFRHEPLRLSVFIAAPEAAIEQVLRAEEKLRSLVKNHWIHLFAITEGGLSFKKYEGSHWIPFVPATIETTNPIRP